MSICFKVLITRLSLNFKRTQLAISTAVMVRIRHLSFKKNKDELKAYRFDLKYDWITIYFFRFEFGARYLIGDTISDRSVFEYGKWTQLFQFQQHH